MISEAAPRRGSASRLATAFDAAGAAGRPLVIPFVTAGYPEAASTVPVVRALAGAGADLVEIGIPFSDPLADGPTIQRSSRQALRGGMSVAGVLEIVGCLRQDGAAIELPVVLMGYSNPLFAYGLEGFLDDAAAAGADGMIVADLPPEEAGEYLAGCRALGLSATFLVAPNAPDERIRVVDDSSTHFSYCVTVTGITGARDSIEDRTLDFLARMRSVARKPFVVGFGVKEPEHVRRLGPHADGVVIGSALIDALAAAENPASAAAALISPLRAAADQVAAGNATREGRR
ncbi:MAG: tryptophan synthase subunit alpha [Acidobacteriota bacterium]